MTTPNVTNDDETAMLSIALTREAEAALTSHDILSALAESGLIVVPAIDGGWMWFVLLGREEPRYLGPDKPFKTAQAALRDGLDALIERGTPAGSGGNGDGGPAP
jgi:hypothetical protein